MNDVYAELEGGFTNNQLFASHCRPNSTTFFTLAHNAATSNTGVLCDYCPETFVTSG